MAKLEIIPKTPSVKVTQFRNLAEGELFRTETKPGAVYLRVIPGPTATHFLINACNLSHYNTARFDDDYPVIPMSGKFFVDEE